MTPLRKYSLLPMAGAARRCLLTLTLLCFGVLHLAAQNELATGVEGSLDQGTPETLAVVPWLSGAFSLVGYPTDALSWFLDGAGRGEYRSATGEGVFASTLLLTGSYRRGLSTIRVDLEADAELSTGETPAAAIGALSAHASTGNVRSSLYGTLRGSVNYLDTDVTWATEGVLGGSITAGPRLAPDLRADGGYAWLPGGDWQADLGLTLTLPWYPAGPWSATLAVGGTRSYGSILGDVEGGSYYPDRYREAFWDVQMFWSPRARMLVEFLVPGSFRLSDHGPVQDEVMQGGREWLLRAAPGLRMGFSLSPSWTLELETGGVLQWSNSPSLATDSAYAGLALRYRFSAGE